jgi:hypothetical protein
VSELSKKISSVEVESQNPGPDKKKGSAQSLALFRVKKNLSAIYVVFNLTKAYVAIF